MFELSDLKQTRVYQEALQEGKQEGKLELVPQLLELGLSVEQVAKALRLSVEQVRQAAKKSAFRVMLISEKRLHFLTVLVAIG